MGKADLDSALRRSAYVPHPDSIADPIGVAAGLQIEVEAVPGARNVSARDDPQPEAAAAVRARVVQRMQAVADPEKRDLATRDGDRQAAPVRRQVLEPGDGVPLEVRLRVTLHGGIVGAASGRIHGRIPAQVSESSAGETTMAHA